MGSHDGTVLCFFLKKKMTLPPTKPFLCQRLSDERYTATVGNLDL